MSSRKELFEIRESKILQTAEQLILESGEGDLTLDSLAQHLDLAKGTLYKHFASKDELLLRILIHHERKLFMMNKTADGAGAGVARMVLQQLRLPQRAMLFNHIEERLASTSSGLNKIFAELYQIRRERMKCMLDIAETYLNEQQSAMTVRDYMASIWAIGQGGAGLLNSSFYQRYLGSRETLKYAFVKQLLDLPKLYPLSDELDRDEGAADGYTKGNLIQGKDQSIASEMQDQSAVGF
ncbi:TetR/AcrR family transcriptional regulator [Moraxella sp.]|uniref:TetR/AcrR family transcriptional regulator n=1 Tax=Moraxella sp. TaxID=479 RepID=UPI002611C2AB|nr:TetR/AcrR family transcriptional regulator [Moraxella sp.]MCP3896539.1 TetR/AcrR family transcriptional regulator [Moraxella sp.]